MMNQALSDNQGNSLMPGPLADLIFPELEELEQYQVPQNQPPMRMPVCKLNSEAWLIQ